MIINIHTHTFPPRIAEAALRSMQENSHTALFSDGTEEGLTADMKRTGIGLSVVQPVATNPEKVCHINDNVIRVNRRIKETGICSFGAMHPAMKNSEAELERLAREGVRGIKLHPCYEDTDIDHPDTIRILRKCGELGMIVLIHSGWDVGIPGSEAALPRKIRNALDAAGRVRMIAAHMGGWKCWEEASRLLPETGISLDTAFSLGRMTRAPGDGHWKDAELELLSPDAFCAMVHLFGTDRILFGTDSPWADAGEEISKIKALPLTEEEIAAILGGNAERLLETGKTAYKETN